MPSVYIETYGCQMNVSDSELMLGKLAAEGYTPVDSPEGADVVLVNTCAIRENAEQRVIGRFGDSRVTYAIFMRRPVVFAPRLALEWLEELGRSRNTAIVAPGSAA